MAKMGAQAADAAVARGNRGGARAAKGVARQARARASPRAAAAAKASPRLGRRDAAAAAAAAVLMANARQARAALPDLNGGDEGEAPEQAQTAAREDAPTAKKPRGAETNALASTVTTVAAAGSIGIILLQNPKGTEGAEVLARSAAFSSVKQSTSFLTYVTWGLIGTFITASVFAAL